MDTPAAKDGGATETPSLPPLQPDEYDVIVPVKSSATYLGVSYRATEMGRKSGKFQVVFIRYNDCWAGEDKPFRNKGDVFLYRGGRKLGTENSKEEATRMFKKGRDTEKKQGFGLFRMRDVKFDDGKSLEDQRNTLRAHTKSHEEKADAAQKEKERLLLEVQHFEMMERLHRRTSKASKKSFQVFKEQAVKVLEQQLREFKTVDLCDDEDHDEEGGKKRAASTTKQGSRKRAAL